MGGLRLTGALIALVAVGLGLALLTANPPARPLKSAALAGLGQDRPLTRIAFGSCADQKDPEPIWDAIGASNPDLFLFAGNAVYGDRISTRAGLPELSAAYRTLSHQTSFRRFRRKVPVLAIWDDHDYGRDDGDRSFSQKSDAKTLFLNFWGIADDSPRAARPGLYDARIMGPPGRRVQIILLDLRWFKDPWKVSVAGARRRYEPDPDPARTLLGPQQWAWLEAELKKEAELRLIVSPIQIEAEGDEAERWGDFPAEQQRLFDLIASTRAGGVVFLSGDRRQGALYRRAADTPYPFFEVTASPLNDPRGEGEGPEHDRLGPLVSAPNFGLITIDWALRTVRLELKDGTGHTAMVASAPLAALAPAAHSNLVREDRP
jgi:alkaline phosphatase D